MHSVNVVADRPGAWARIRWQARWNMSLWTLPAPTFAGLHHNELWQAVQDMHAEQRADGMRRGASLCDYGDCGRVGSHVWERTAKELKSMRCGGKKGIAPLPSVCHCEEHIPSWRVSSYRPVGVRVSREAVAA